MDELVKLERSLVAYEQEVGRLETLIKYIRRKGTKSYPAQITGLFERNGRSFVVDLYEDGVYEDDYVTLKLPTKTGVDVLQLAIRLNPEIGVPDEEEWLAWERVVTGIWVFVTEVGEIDEDFVTELKDNDGSLDYLQTEKINGPYYMQTAVNPTVTGLNFGQLSSEPCYALYASGDVDPGQPPVSGDIDPSIYGKKDTTLTHEFRFTDYCSGAFIDAIYSPAGAQYGNISFFIGDDNGFIPSPPELALGRECGEPGHVITTIDLWGDYARAAFFAFARDIKIEERAEGFFKAGSLNPEPYQSGDLLFSDTATDAPKTVYTNVPMIRLAIDNHPDNPVHNVSLYFTPLAAGLDKGAEYDETTGPPFGILEFSVGGMYPEVETTFPFKEFVHVYWFYEAFRIDRAVLISGPEVAGSLVFSVLSTFPSLSDFSINNVTFDVMGGATTAGGGFETEQGDWFPSLVIPAPSITNDVGHDFERTGGDEIASIGSGATRRAKLQNFVVNI